MYQYPLIYVYFGNDNYRNCFANYGANRFHGTVRDGHSSIKIWTSWSTIIDHAIPAYFIEPVINLISTHQRLLINLIAFLFQSYGI